jgi:hypothetical protein
MKEGNRGLHNSRDGTLDLRGEGEKHRTRDVFDQARIAGAFARCVGEPWSEFVREVSLVRFGGLAPREQRKAHQRASLQYTAFENYELEQLAVRGVNVSLDIGM